MVPEVPSIPHVAVIGLGYVGLPLAVEFGKHFDTIGFDINSGRVDELRAGRDSTHEVEPEEFAAAGRLQFATNMGEVGSCNVYIVTVPTPVDEHKRPDFDPLIKASGSIGQVLTRGDVVIYESTVYPGATEEICIPELERASGLVFNQDFTVGYSPERINPGDKERRLIKIPKVTSGSTPATADFVDALYARIITAGTYKAPSIKVAEASKVIENTQRDANIALVNEFARIFRRMGIDTHEVLAAARTKWNFLPFRPGLVGGHCIGVDPYYLIQKAQSTGYYPDILLACRRINDAMGNYVATEVMKLVVRKKGVVPGAKVLVLGFAFKQDCPDLRNTRVIDVIRELESFDMNVDVFDPLVPTGKVREEYGFDLLDHAPNRETYDVVIFAVAHDALMSMGADAIRSLGKKDAVIYDITGALPPEIIDGRL